MNPEMLKDTIWCFWTVLWCHLSRLEWWSIVARLFKMWNLTVWTPDWKLSSHGIPLPMIWFWIEVLQIIIHNNLWLFSYWNSCWIWANATSGCPEWPLQRHQLLQHNGEWEEDQNQDHPYDEAVRGDEDDRGREVDKFWWLLWSTFKRTVKSLGMFFVGLL